jgi:hypothetical protein
MSSMNIQLHVERSASSNPILTEQQNDISVYTQLFNSAIDPFLYAQASIYALIDRVHKELVNQLERLIIAVTVLFQKCISWPLVVTLLQVADRLAGRDPHPAKTAVFRQQCLQTTIASYLPLTDMMSLCKVSKDMQMPPAAMLRGKKDIEEKLSKKLRESNGNFDALAEPIKRFIRKNGKSLHFLNLAFCNNLRGEQLKKLVELFPNLTHLHLYGCTSLVTSDLTFIKPLPLTKLNLSECPNITQLNALEKMALKELHLNESRIRNDALQSLSYLPLEVLELSSLRITNDGLTHLSKLPLKILSLGCEQITNRGVQHLRACPLKELYLNHCNVTGEVVEHLIDMPLISFEMRNLGLSSFFYRLLLELQNVDQLSEVMQAFMKKHGGHLDTLEIHHLHSSLTDNQLQKLVSFFPKLIYVDVENCFNLTDAGIAHLQSLSLNRLKIAGCRVTNTSLQLLGAMPLKRLEIGFANITDEGIDSLQNPTLEEVYLFGCNDITYDAVKRLVARLPNLRSLRYNRRTYCDGKFLTEALSLDNGLWRYYNLQPIECSVRHLDERNL